MPGLKEICEQLTEKLHLKYLPVGLYHADAMPEKSLTVKKSGNGCIMPLIFASAKSHAVTSQIVAFDENSIGWNCSAFYLGYRKWIFPGIENFLSNVDIGRECERFVKTPGMTRKYIESLVPETLEKRAAIFKPLRDFDEGETPEVVIFFADADRMSALVSLLHFAHPEDDRRVITQFASACAAVTTFPLKYARAGEDKAFWGLHDISARARLPKELSTLAMPYSMFLDMTASLDDTFLYTSQWARIEERLE